MENDFLSGALGRIAGPRKEMIDREHRLPYPAESATGTIPVEPLLRDCAFELPVPGVDAADR